MALDFSPSALINGGSGLLYIAVGVLILVLARVKMARALAGYCIAFGAGLVVINLLGDDYRSIGLWARGLTSLGAGAFLVWFHFNAPWREGASRRAVIAAAATAVVVGVVGGLFASNPAYLAVAQVGGYEDPVAAQVASAGGVALLGAATFVALAAGLARPRNARAAALLTLGVLAYHVFNDFTVLSHPDILAGGWEFAAKSAPGIIAVAVVGMAWLPSSRVPAWGLLAIGLAAMLANALLPDFNGAVGIVRCLAALVIVLAVVRHDLLAKPLSAPKVRRGALATGALAVLFIVAQIAQNFFSAEYGLLTGGVIAGTFLFAASPIQKRIEAMGARTTPGAPPADGNDQAFRAAVQFALRDRRLSPEEELSLADLAERLGVGARRATEIRLAVEKERGVR